VKCIDFIGWCGKHKGRFGNWFWKKRAKIFIFGGENIKWEIKGKMNAVEGRTQ